MKVRLARVAKPHGVRGEVKIEAFTDDLPGFSSYRSFVVAGETREITFTKRVGRFWIARIRGFETVEAAGKLRGAWLELDRKELPGEGPFIVDYLGRRFRLNDEPAEIGEIRDYYEAPQGGLFEAVFDAGHVRLVPIDLKIWPAPPPEGPVVLHDPEREWCDPLA